MKRSARILAFSLKLFLLLLDLVISVGTILCRMCLFMTFEGCHQHIGWRNLKDTIILEFCDLILGLLLLLSELILGLNGTRAVLADSNLVLL